MSECDFDLTLFQARAVRTVAWCLHRLAISEHVDSLWSLMPRDTWLLDRPRGGPYDKPTAESRREALAPVFKAQADYFDTLPANDEYMQIYKTGRLLVFMPDVTLSDPAAEVESEGFYNWDGYPPADTWLYYVDDQPSMVPTLISWVPPKFIERAEGGVQVNPEECIIFLKDWPEPNPCYVETLREAGLLV